MQNQDEITLKSRQSKIELLRIFAMFLIIAHHMMFYCVKSIPTLPINKAIYSFFSVGGKVGVNVYVMISAFFFVNKSFSIKKIINIFLQTTFYSLLAFSLYFIVSKSQFSFEYFLHSLFPVFYGEYSFVTYYCFIVLISPLLNIIIHNINQKTYTTILAIGIFLCCIMPEFMNINFFSSTPLIFCLLYFIGAYVRIYSFEIKLIVMNYLLFFGVIASMLIVNISHYSWYNSNSLLNLFLSVILIKIFLKFKIQSKSINFIASLSFGVFLIHENGYIRPRLWEIFEIHNIGQNYFFIFIVISISLLVYVLCSIIELVRKYLIFTSISKFCLKLRQKILSGKIE